MTRRRDSRRSTTARRRTGRFDASGVAVSIAVLGAVGFELLSAMSQAIEAERAVADDTVR